MRLSFIFFGLSSVFTIVSSLPLGPNVDLAALTNAFTEIQASVDAITPEISSLVTSVTPVAPVTKRFGASQDDLGKIAGA
ncbi:hypothetical protein G6F62_011990 [Rhizopus arrhizus]|nr:hypothetical protein G6F23_013777 [Rhizopus arrhizus]KAG0775503.1 hypothetical protein G6F21_013902 [Rhizopus arrhizus]KAG0779807.1 hypothetical protein G6F22_010431 [Rhizopus arrhizus]KAG0815697.1 hypothetical protein G6F20_003796 [Rhizopus arrhizus]KAG0818399.1 hypothetical protein G6F19_012701 [Rhizopus arrhizus]